MKELVQEMVTLRRLRWLGHVARMGDNRMPKQVCRARPFHGVKLRWKERVKRDLTMLEHWYWLAQDRKKWYDLYHERVEQVARRLEQEQAKRQTSQHNHRS